MAWFKGDDHLDENPKIVGLSDRAFRANIEGICYAARNLTDGFLPPSVVARRWPKARPELLTAELWHSDQSGGVWIHDFLDYNPSRADTMSKREAERRRKGGGNPEPRDAETAEDSGRNPGQRELPRTRTHTQPSALPVPQPGPDPVAPAKPPRARDPLFDALCEVCGMDPYEVVGAEATRVGVSISKVRKLAGFTVDEVFRRGSDENWARVMGDATKTPAAICTNWARLAGVGRQDRKLSSSERVLALADDIERREVGP